jgi:hypothetical protein
MANPEGDRSPADRRLRRSVLVEDGLILAAVGALGVAAFRKPLGLEGWPTAALLAVTLAAMVVVFVRRLRRWTALRRERGAADRGKHAD